MEKIKLKVCGMKDGENIQKITSLNPDYMGFIFYPSSPRYVGESFRLTDSFSPEITPVGVFVNETTEIIKTVASQVGLKMIQLHGRESADQCRELKSEGYQVVKVFSVDNNFDFMMTKPYKKAVNYFLFDTKGKYFGGNSETFDWDLLKRYDQHIPFFLSGGLSPENVDKVSKLKGMNVHALDINSGVEVSPGIKDYNKVKEVMEKLQALL